MKLRRTWVSIAALGLCVPRVAAGEPVDLLSGVRWEYSLDKGKTYTDGPMAVPAEAEAMFAGHDHTYERSAVDGLTFITSGGAGAPRYGKSKLAEKQNPHSVVYHSVLHYCLLTVADGSCTMKAYTPQGEEIDTRTWGARRFRQ